MPSPTQTLPSRGVLLIGGLGLFWLVLAALLVLHLEVSSAAEDAADVTRAENDVAPSITSEPEWPLDLFSRPPSPAEAGEGVAERAAGQGELQTLASLEELFLLVHDRLDDASYYLDAEARRMAAEVGERMNADGRTVVARFRDPDLDLARRRAVRAHAVLVEAGLLPWLLESFGERGEIGFVLVHVD